MQCRAGCHTHGGILRPNAPGALVCCRAVAAVCALLVAGDARSPHTTVPVVQAVHNMASRASIEAFPVKLDASAYTVAVGDRTCWALASFGAALRGANGALLGAIVRAILDKRCCVFVCSTTLAALTFPHNILAAVTLA